MVTYVEHAMIIDKVETPRSDNDPQQGKQPQRPYRRVRLRSCKRRNSDHEEARSEEIGYGLDENRPAVHEEKIAADVGGVG